MQGPTAHVTTEASRRLALSLALCAALAGCVAGPPAATPRPAPDVPQDPFASHALLSRPFLHIAHRGGARLAPEETLPAYQRAVELGVDVLEADLHQTADGEIICIHDASLERTTDGEGLVIEHTWAELAELDAGYHFTTDGGASYPFRGQGVRILRLAELLDTWPEQLFSFEMKPSSAAMVPSLLALLEEREMTDQVVLMSFFPEPIAAVRAARPDILTALSAQEMLGFVEMEPEERAVYEAPGRHAHLPLAYGPIEMDAELVSAFQSRGMQVHLWTLNDREELEYALEIGADGAFTDDPALLAEILAEPG